MRAEDEMRAEEVMRKDGNAIHYSHQLCSLSHDIVIYVGRSYHMFWYIRIPFVKHHNSRRYRPGIGKFALSFDHIIP